MNFPSNTGATDTGTMGAFTQEDWMKWAAMSAAMQAGAVPGTQQMQDTSTPSAAGGAAMGPGSTGQRLGSTGGDGSWVEVAGGKRNASAVAKPSPLPLAGRITVRHLAVGKVPTTQKTPAEASNLEIKPLFGGGHLSNISLTKCTAVPSDVKKKQEVPTPPRAVIVKGWVRLDRDYGTRNPLITPGNIAEAMSQSLTARGIKAHVAKATKKTTSKEGDKWRTDYFLWIVPGKTAKDEPSAEGGADVPVLKELYLELHLLIVHCNSKRFY